MRKGPPGTLLGAGRARRPRPPARPGSDGPPLFSFRRRGPCGSQSPNCEWPPPASRLPAPGSRLPPPASRLPAACGRGAQLRAATPDPADSGRGASPSGRTLVAARDPCPALADGWRAGPTRPPPSARGATLPPGLWVLRLRGRRGVPLRCLRTSRHHGQRGAGARPVGVTTRVSVGQLLHRVLSLKPRHRQVRRKGP